MYFLIRTIKDMRLPHSPAPDSCAFQDVGAIKLPKVLLWE
jgi:hypothetical protein